MLITSGDVNGDGKREIVISDGHDIRIYTSGHDLKEIWHIKGGNDEEHIYIDASDINNNGIDEIFVSSATGNTTFTEEITDTGSPPEGISAVSYVLEYSRGDGEFRKTATLRGYFLRVLGGGLLMQRFNPFSGFIGPVHHGRWQDGQYVPSSHVTLPEGVNIYGFASVDWNNSGREEIITFDDEGHILLYDDDGQILWKSREGFGESLIKLRKEKTLSDPKGYVPVRGRLFPVRTEQGQEVIVMSRVPFVSVVPGLGAKGARLYALWWDGSNMHTRVLLDEVPGMITDFLVEEDNVLLLAKGNLLSFLKHMTQGELKKGSTLYYYRLR